MKKLILTILFTLPVFFVSACTDDKPKTFADVPVKELEKAQDVEQVLQQSAEDQQKKVEEQLR